MQPKTYSNLALQQQLAFPIGLVMRTGLCAGVCVDVNVQTLAALQTLTDALSGATTIVAPIATDTITVSS